MARSVIFSRRTRTAWIIVISLVVAGCTEDTGRNPAPSAAVDGMAAEAPSDRGRSNDASLSEADQTTLSEVPKFPRDIVIEGGLLTAYEPQIEKYEGNQKITAWVAAVVDDKMTGEVVYGALKVRADVHANFEDRTVTIYNRTLIDSYFPAISSSQATSLARRIEVGLSDEPSTFPLDVLLAYLADHGAEARSIEVSMEPPQIFYSAKPAVLLMFDGEPVFAPVGDPQMEGTLTFAVNTNWTVLREKESDTLYLMLGERWLTADDYQGPWLPADKVPESFGTLPDHPNWDQARKAIPAPPIEPEPIPNIYVSTEPAELIVTDGRPVLGDIEGAGLAVVTNTLSDVFMDRETGSYYYLVSGRWFRASTLEGPWQAAGPLPGNFAKIPEDHPRAHVRSAVPGTVEAQFAVMQAQIPTKAEVRREGTTVEVSYAGQPEFEAIKKTDLERAVNTPFDVIKVDDQYYLVHEGVWFVSPDPMGPWVVADEIPPAIYDIPPNSPSHHVTYVYVYDSTPDVVYVGYTPGYHHHYVSFGISIYGSGYYWPAYYHYYDPFYYPYWPYYPVYYPYHHAYGFGAYYNPATGTYGRGAAVYGPYGGFGRGASHNPTTGRYSRGVAAWGPEGGAYARQAYNPRTGVYSETIQSANSYASWGESYVRRGDDWIKTSRYSDSRGTGIGAETSRGGKAVGVTSGERTAGIVRTGTDDLYVGANGNVFRRTEDGWEGRQDGSWSPLDKSDRDRLGDRAESGRTMQRDTGDYVRRRDTQSGNYVDRLNRDARARTYGNQRYDRYRSSGGRHGNLSRRGGGRRR